MTNGINGIMNGIEYENGINGINILWNIDDTLGSVPGLAKFLPGNVASNSIIESTEEIYSERLPYLINTDDLLEEILR